MIYTILVKNYSHIHCVCDCVCVCVSECVWVFGSVTMHHQHHQPNEVLKSQKSRRAGRNVTETDHEWRQMERNEHTLPLGSADAALYSVQKSRRGSQKRHLGFISLSRGRTADQPFPIWLTALNKHSRQQGHCSTCQQQSKIHVLMNYKYK